MGDWKIIPDDDCVDINDNGIVTFNKECNNLKDKYTVIYNNGMCESKTYIIVKKEDVCNKFIVDGGEWDNVPSTGAATCDSAFLWVDGTPQFTPASASTWITINKYYWDTDDPSTMCTNYGNYPCVANNLMYQAGLVTTQVNPCNAEHNPPLTSLPKVVQDAVNKIGEYKHALGTIRYTVAPNPTNKPRSCTIRWIVNSQECPSRDFTISQLGTLVCKCNDLKVSGNKTIDSSARSNFEIGTYTAGCVTNIAASEPADWITSISPDNGFIKASINENTSTTNTRATEITVTGKAGSDICTKSFTLTQNPKSETCTCNNMKFSADTYSVALEADEGASENINVDYTCEPTISCSDAWFTANMQNKVIYVIANSKNPTTSVRSGEILIKDANNSTCKKIDVSQEAGTGCDKPYPRSIKVRVKANSDLTIAGAINLNNLGNDTLTFSYGDESQESIDLAGYQVNAINLGGESVWKPTDSLDNVICTDKPGLEHYEFDGFPESFTVTIGGLNHEARQRDGMPNGHYATVDTSYYFYLDYEVILDGNDVKFTIVIKQD